MIMKLIIKDTFPSQNPPSVSFVTTRGEFKLFVVVREKDYKINNTYISIYEYELYNVTEKKVERY